MNKIVLVTGGASGIGREIVRHFAKLGATVLIVDVDEEKGRRVLKEIQALSEHSFFYQCDLRNDEEIKSLFIFIKEKFNRCDILINNAGISEFKNLLTCDIKYFDEVISVNLRAAFIMSQEFYRLNRGCNYGRIINIASTRAFMSEPNSEAYAASKGGLVALTHALALSLSEEHITVNCISPGWIQNTNYEELTHRCHAQHPSKRVGKPEDIAKMCLFLCEEENDFITGENIIIDGGMTKKMIYE